MAKTPRKKTFVWNDFRFQWMEHTEEVKTRGRRKRVVKQYRVTVEKRGGFIGWFDDVESAKRHIIRSSVSTLFENAYAMEERVADIKAELRELTERFARLKKMVDDVPEERKAKNRRSFLPGGTF